MDVTILREALQTVPNHSCELIVKAISEKLANALGEQVNLYIYTHTNLSIYLSSCNKDNICEPFMVLYRTNDNKEYASERDSGQIFWFII